MKKSLLNRLQTGDKAKPALINDREVVVLPDIQKMNGKFLVGLCPRNADLYTEIMN